MVAVGIDLLERFIKAEMEYEKHRSPLRCSVRTELEPGRRSAQVDLTSPIAS